MIGLNSTSEKDAYNILIQGKVSTNYLRERGGNACRIFKVIWSVRHYRFLYFLFRQLRKLQRSWRMQVLGEFDLWGEVRSDTREQVGLQGEQIIANNGGVRWAAKCFTHRCPSELFTDARYKLASTRPTNNILLYNVVTLSYVLLALFYIHCTLCDIWRC